MSARLFLWAMLWTVPGLVLLVEAIGRRRLALSTLLLISLLAGGYGITLRGVTRSEHYGTNENAASRGFNLRLPGVAVSWSETRDAEGALVRRSHSWAMLLPPTLLVALPSLAIFMARRRREP